MTADGQDRDEGREADTTPTGPGPPPGGHDAPGGHEAPPGGQPPDDAPAGESAYDLLRRGTTLAGKRHHAQAAVVLQRAAALEPRRGSILEPLGRAYFMSGQLDRAHETFTALLEVDPTSPYGHYALGRTLARLGRTGEGITHLRLAVALAPDSRLFRGALERHTTGEERRGE
jgi:tetratricopeptide (TPR) repeat protein